MNFFVASSVALLLCLCIEATPSGSKHSPVSKEFIAKINEKATTWKAGKNFDEDTPVEHLKMRLGLLPKKHPTPDHLLVRHTIPDDFDLPDNLDLREKWNRTCPSLKEVRDQGSCGSCWAFASVEVMTDRTCIHSFGKYNFHYSAQDLTSCCKDCGLGCFGGVIETPFDYWTNNGLVSGGGYKSKEGCSPYLIPSDGGFHLTPPCNKTCQKSYGISYADDLHFGKRGYYEIEQNEKSIMYEISIKGPVVAAMDVYADFYNYVSGVYEHAYGELMGGHAIKIMGYGVENGTKYWLCTNSWGYSWGDKGFFKILRGKNNCGIESRVTAGEPSLEEF